MNLLTEARAAASVAASAAVRRLGFYALIAILSLVMLSFGAAAGWTALADMYGPIAASLGVAGAAAFMLIVLLIADRMRHRARMRRAARAAAMARPPQPHMGPAMAQAFVAAMQVGASLRR